jgi:hypothetical protein
MDYLRASKAGWKCDSCFAIISRRGAENAEPEKVVFDRMKRIRKWQQENY